MDLRGIISIAGGIAGLVGGVAGFLSWLNQRKRTAIMQDQLNVMREQLRSAKHQEGSATEWARKFDEAAEALSKICSNTITTGPSTVVEAYRYVFKQDDLRRRIEIYLGRRKTWVHTFIPAILGREQLQNPVVQQTIQPERPHRFRQDIETALR